MADPNETRLVSSTGAEKGSKLERYDLIPAEPLRLLARHYGRGAEKYAERNWERGYGWHLSYSALNRHLWAFWNGEDTDEETGSPHMVAVAWHAFALLEFARAHPDFDTRPNTLKGSDDPRPRRFGQRLDRLLDILRGIRR